MLIKKVYVLYFLIGFINILILLKFVHFNQSNFNYCLISSEISFKSFAFDEKHHHEKLNNDLKHEIIDLEKQRNMLINEIYSKNIELTKLHNDVYQHSLKSVRLRNSIISLQQIRKDYQRRHKTVFYLNPIISKFNYISTEISFDIYKSNRNYVDLNGCTVFSCFNFQNCSSTEPFKFNVADFDQRNNDLEEFLAHFKQSIFYSKEKSCLKILIRTKNSSKTMNTNCNNNGNCAILVVNSTNDSLINSTSLVISNHFLKTNFRFQYDIVSSVFVNLNTTDLTMIFPFKRRYLMSYSTFIQQMDSLPHIDQYVINYLHNVSIEIQKETGSSQFYLDINCTPTKPKVEFSQSYGLCDNFSVRIRQMKRSKFCLILSSWNTDILISEFEQHRLIECLIAGSIPIIIGDLMLPFDEIIDWNSAVLRFPKQRVNEIINIIERMPDNDCWLLKFSGRQLLETHLLTVKRQLDSIGLVLTNRLKLPLPSSPNYPAKLLYDYSIISNTNRTVVDDIRYYNFTLPNFQIEIDPYLGPNNIPATKSVIYPNNITRNNYQNGATVSGLGSSRYFFYPSTPWDPQLPTDAVLKGYLARGYYSINHSLNEAGTEFMHSLGGNYVYEQFTIVILAFKRQELLKKSIELLKGLPYLHSVIVIWNDQHRPPKDFLWPKLHVDLKIVQSSGNSLNNRFLPYDIIETDAVLSFDDDIQLRHDEIVFAFRVWRENRDRIVGFPARYHTESPGTSKMRYSNNQWWMYNSNYTCEYSMVLTGAAFIHKFYLFAYSNDMHPEIRRIVDKYHNCEDIAMNFLVSHLTRKSPLKVTVRWTFSCINCDPDQGSKPDESLHGRANHYEVRSNCINEFSAIYGYNPLLYSQYRADSVLFKTRLPYDKQKCFRFI